MSSEPWRLVVTGPAARDLDRLPDKAFGAVLGSLEAIARNPHRVGKPLRFDLEGLWVARRGSYRVIYRIDDTGREVVLAIDHRRDVYRLR
jgi:mRNA-degrading endonuclease RelE of RelBE toxin-antitoxin system